ncbi:MAG: LEA type 2 family protein [Bacteroidales bacterium]|nr:LEA type 2 family protein [Bacteroidales bacterium]
MKIKSIILTLGTMLMLAGCADIKRLKDMEVESVSLENFRPRGLRGATVTLLVEVDNPGVQVSLSEISADVEHSGKVLGKVAVDPFTLQGKTTDTYRLEAELTLAEGVNVFELGKLLDKKALEKMTVDVSADVRIRKGKIRTMKINDLPVKKLIESVK